FGDQPRPQRPDAAHPRRAGPALVLGAGADPLQRRGKPAGHRADLHAGPRPGTPGGGPPGRRHLDDHAGTAHPSRDGPAHPAARLAMNDTRFPRGLYGVTPDWDDTDRLLSAIAEAHAGGMRVLQWRRKHGPAAARRSQATEV